jgi:hypothetical protein
MKKVIMIGVTLLLTLGLTACGSSSSAAANQSQPIKAHKQNGSSAKKQKNISIVKNEILLNVLKMDPISLRQELNTGKSIVEVGKEKNVTEDQMVNALIQQRVNAAKKNGKTDAQINQLKTKWTQQIKKQLERTYKSKSSN